MLKHIKNENSPFLSADSIKAEFGGAFGSYQTNIRTPCMRQSLAPPGLLKWMSNKGWFLVVRVLFWGKQLNAVPENELHFNPCLDLNILQTGTEKKLKSKSDRKIFFTDPH